MLALIKIPAHLGYLVLFGLVGAESTGVPVPGETALITAGVLAHHGRFNIELVIVIAAVAAILGDNIGYLIGRNGGRRLLARPGFLEGHRRQILEKGEPFFQRHGPKAVFLGRWVAGLRIAAAWLAGINRMPWHIFVFWNALGGIAWATSVGLLSYYLGPAAERIFKVAGLAGIAVAVVIVFGHFLWHRHRNKQEAASAPSRPAPIGLLAPGSKPQHRWRRATGRAGCRSEQPVGEQREVHRAEGGQVDSSASAHSPGETPRTRNL